MLGRKELDRLNLERQALLVESASNRLALQAEVGALRSATAGVGSVAGGLLEGRSLLLVLAPLAGFLLARVSRRPDSWSNRLVAAIKWIAPLYQLWRSLRSGKKPTEAAGAAE